MNAAIDAKIGKPSSRGDVDEKVVLPRLSRGVRRLVDACREPLGRRGMATGEGTTAMKVCFAIADGWRI